ncbi:MAG: N-carbamoylputrescine amidase [Coriobacteriales bacterium]|jgi:N-carbamoylputrescine amidase|nr:N-carbamoylputrescine amidase [Coriobacteriales bacterium]
MRTVTVAATQMPSLHDRERNIECACGLVREAAERGAQVVLLQELFETDYFCQQANASAFELALPVDENPAVRTLGKLARELRLVIPVSIFERSGQSCFNTLVLLGPDGSVMGSYRKSHIPDGPGYEEKFFFDPGDSGFKVWDTPYGRLGCGICWDQWFPEAARIMALMGAELLLYPTAIGSEPLDPAYDSRPHWQTCMQGHAAANMVPLLASNRVGTEHQAAVPPAAAPPAAGSSITFYGSSFIADACGQIVAQAPREGTAVITACFDLDELWRRRRAWGLFRDRRPDLYAGLLARTPEGIRDV